MRRVALFISAVALGGCINFNADVQDFCTQYPQRCAGSGGGSGGAQGGGSGGAQGGGSGGAQGGGSGGGTGGGEAACKPFGSDCAGPTDCCATTLIGDAGFPMACGRTDFCVLTAADCNGAGTHCADGDQCCSASCTGGRCAACAKDQEACTKAANCCVGYQCGDDGKCHSATAGSSGPDGGQCTSSSVCLAGYCDLSTASAQPQGVCKDPAASSCTPSKQMPGQTCCPGLSSPTGTCCQPDNSWCYYDSDCCSDNCYGGRCVQGRPTTGMHCDYTSNCVNAVEWCDPVENICVDRWCFNSIATPYKGCCQLLANTCRFLDGGTCLLPGAASASDATCCSGIRTATNECDSIQIFDP